MITNEPNDYLPGMEGNIGEEQMNIDPEFIYQEPDFYSRDWIKKEMYSIAITASKNEHDARDIVQNVITNFLTHCHRHQGEQIANPQGYMYNMLQNEIINYHKNKQRRPENPDYTDSIDNIGISLEALDVNMVKDIYKIFKNEPENLDILRLRFKGMILKEIAFELSLPLHTIKLRIGKIRPRIEQYLKK